MIFDSALADAEIRGDVLAGMTGEDQFHDLALLWREPRDTVCRMRPSGEQLGQSARLLDQLVVSTA